MASRPFASLALIVVAAGFAASTMTGCAGRSRANDLDTAPLGGPSAVMEAYLMNRPEVQVVTGPVTESKVARSGQYSSNVPFFGWGHASEDYGFEFLGPKGGANVDVSLYRKNSGVWQVKRWAVTSKAEYDRALGFPNRTADDDAAQTAALAAVLADKTVAPRVGTISAIDRIEFALPLTPVRPQFVWEAEPTGEANSRAALDHGEVRLAGDRLQLVWMRITGDKGQLDVAVPVQKSGDKWKADQEKWSVGSNGAPVDLGAYSVPPKLTRIHPK